MIKETFDAGDANDDGGVHDDGDVDINDGNMLME